MTFLQVTQVSYDGYAIRKFPWATQVAQTTLERQM